MSKKSGLKSLLLIFLQNSFSWFVQHKAKKGHLEVERKFSITASESESLPLKLRELQFRPSGSVSMTDTFIPPREAGEMMRVRDEVTADSARSVFTLKSWVHTTGGGKERKESEAEVSPLLRTLAIMLARFVSPGELLSFSKDRALFEGKISGRELVVALDRVTGLGEYSGHFLEAECIVPLGEDPSKVQEIIFELVEQLFGSRREDVKRSYLDMLKLSKQAR